MKGDLRATMDEHWQNRAEAAEDENARLRVLISHATQAADWEPGDAQRALRELRDVVAALSRTGRPEGESGA